MLPDHPVLAENLRHRAMRINRDDRLDLGQIKWRAGVGRRSVAEHSADVDAGDNQNWKSENASSPPKDGLLSAIAEEQKHRACQRVSQQNITPPDQDSVNQPEQCQGRESSGIE